jgi:N-formylglutamate amidohydrolase
MSSLPKSFDPWNFEPGQGPIVATAIHGGHDLRPEVARYVALSDEERLREEDPYTGGWTTIGDSRGVVHRSRFEVDLNRPREKAVYLDPAESWGLQVWRQPLPEELIEESRLLHDRFYEDLGGMLRNTVQRWGKFVVLDLHSYNHRRRGSGEPAGPAENPDVNLGTRSVNREAWGTLIDGLMDHLRGYEVNDRPLDVRKNVRFQGAHLVGWVNSTFPQACAVAVEVKKIYMDELTGVLDHAAWKEVHRALEGAAAVCRAELRK